MSSRWGRLTSSATFHTSSTSTTVTTTTTTSRCSRYSSYSSPSPGQTNSDKMSTSDKTVNDHKRPSDQNLLISRFWSRWKTFAGPSHWPTLLARVLVPSVTRWWRVRLWEEIETGECAVMWGPVRETGTRRSWSESGSRCTRPGSEDSITNRSCD